MNPMPIRTVSRARLALPRPRDRRGVAMILVMVALGTATTLTATYVSARNSTPAIGMNALASTTAEWAAKSAADTAVAILQTEANWAGDADPTALLSDFWLSGAKVSVLVTNLDGEAATATDTDLLVTATAVTGSTRKVLQRIVRRQTSVKPLDVVDPYLNEFAVFASNSLKIEDTARVAPWSLSPVVKSNKKVKLGAGFSSSGSLTIEPGATVIDTALVVDSNAYASLRARTADPGFVPGDALPVRVPAAPAALPSAMNSLVTRASVNQTFSMAISATLASGRYQDVTMKDWFVGTLDAANGANYSFNDLRIDNRGTLRIKGKVAVHVREDLEVKNYASIELADASSEVVFYVARNMTVDNAGVGIPRLLAQNASRKAEDVSAYAPPGKIRFTALTALTGGDTYSVNVKLQNKAVVNGVMHFPYADITLDGDSVAIGRLTGDEVVLKKGTTLLYDPALDNNGGFTARAGPLYASDGSPTPGLVTGLSTFNPLLGVDLLPGVVQTAIDTAGVLTSVLTSPGATPRMSERAQAAEWPATALALEQSAPTDTAGIISTNELNTRLVAQKTALIEASKVVAVDTLD